MVTVELELELELEILEVSAISFGNDCSYIFERSFMCATDDSKESCLYQVQGYTSLSSFEFL